MPRTRDELTVDVAAGKVYRRDGKEVGNHTADGYYEVWYEGRRVKRYHLIWFKAYGYWAKPGTIDHINRVRDDDRLANLRETDVTGLAHNREQRYKFSGLARGVSYNRGKYRASFCLQGKRQSRVFDTEAEAASWYMALKRNHIP